MNVLLTSQDDCISESSFKWKREHSIFFFYNKKNSCELSRSEKKICWARFLLNSISPFLALFPLTFNWIEIQGFNYNLAPYLMTTNISFWNLILWIYIYCSFKSLMIIVWRMKTIKVWLIWANCKTIIIKDAFKG